MTQVPQGAQISDDGNWWWDGSQWQPMPQAGGDQTGPAGGQQPAIHEALTSMGVSADASTVGDPQATAGVAATLAQWYGGLDSTSQAIVDALCSQGMTHLLADADVGVVPADSANLLYAFASSGHTLGSAIDTLHQAIGQAGSGTATA